MEAVLIALRCACLSHSSAEDAPSETPAYVRPGYTVQIEDTMSASVI